MNVSEYIMIQLEEKGIDTIFLLAGGGSMFLCEAARKSNMKIVPVLHEQSAVIASDAYNQYHNDLKSAVIVTTGPGGLNALTGMVASFIDSTPLLIISGQVKMSDLRQRNNCIRQFGVQEVDVLNMIGGYTKHCRLINNSNKTKAILDELYYIAITCRKGPVWVEVPLDIQREEIEIDKLIDTDFTNFTEYGMNECLEVHHSRYIKMNKIIDLLNKSKKPVILAGNGIRSSECLDEYKELFRELNIPVLLTWKAIDFLEEDHKLNFGRPGIIGQRYSNIIQQEADLIICIGARLDNCQVAFDYKNFAKDAKKVIIDIDMGELKKFGEDVLKFHINAESFYRLLDKKKDSLHIEIDEWINYCRELKKKYPLCLSEYYENTEVNPYVFTEILSELSQEGDIIIPDSSGSASEIIQQAFKIKLRQRMICNPGLGSMGFQLPHAIGASFASGKQILCISGDGSLAHNLQELELLKRYTLPIKLFVWNNKQYASIRNTQNKFFEGNLIACDDSCGVTLPDIIEIGKAYRIKTEIINSYRDMKIKLKKVLAFDGPVICEVMIDPEFQTQPKVQAKIVDGKIISCDMKDMWPYI
jgi:acetolactate synthase-1/2/3 large subunit